MPTINPQEHPNLKVIDLKLRKKALWRAKKKSPAINTGQVNSVARMHFTHYNPNPTPPTAA